ncbi:MAG: hypothetical protein JXR68_04885 [Bacteroidales bacterium]|nr:hypothetical protein [Bacteroidales bacterium]
MKNFFLLSLMILPLIVNSQQFNELIIDVNLFDYPYQNLAAKTVSNSSYPNFDVKNSDYFKAFINPSMKQSINLSSSFYNSVYFGISKMNINWFNTDFVNYLTESLIETGVILVVEFIPLGDAWLHEEFHRAVLTKNYVNSYNEVNNFPLFKELISVNNVTDNDLVRFKSDNPSDFVRLHAAGIEGEYMLIRNLQSKNIFHNQQHGYFLNSFLWTANSFYYVFFCHQNDAEETTIEINAQDGSNIPKRDFTGLDFTAWVYDLFKPDEPYSLRGTHPSGVGLNRYIAPSDLTEAEFKYLKKQGFLQLINFASPMILGINNLPLTIKGNKYVFNFAFRHFLTSFGYDISLDLFLKSEKFNFLVSTHSYSNQQLTLPGIELNIVDYILIDQKFKVLTSTKSMVWLQPENLFFSDKKSKLGGLIGADLKIGREKVFFDLNFQYKSKGWVAAEVFQSNNFSAGFGLSLYL